MSGFLLKWIQFSTQTTVENVPAEAIAGLGKVGGFLLLGLYLASLVFILAYPIDRGRYEEIRGALDENTN